MRGVMMAGDESRAESGERDRRPVLALMQEDEMETRHLHTV